MPREREGHDAITLSTAARMLGMAETTVARFRREGLLVRLDGVPTYSRADVEEFIANPWLNGRQAAVVLGVSPERVSQLANTDGSPSTSVRPVIGCTASVSSKSLRAPAESATSGPPDHPAKS